MEKDNVILTEDQLKEISGGANNKPYNLCERVHSPLECNKQAECYWTGSMCKKK